MTAFIRLLGNELKLILGRRRNQAGLAVLAGVPVVMALALFFSGRPARGLLAGNGLMVPMTALYAGVPFFLPLAIAMLSGDSIAGEAQIGTLRYLLAVPVGRSRLLIVKGCALLVGCLLSTCVVGLIGTGTGLALFGAGPTVGLSGDKLEFADAVLRVSLMYLYTAVVLMALAGIGLFISTLTEQPLAATVTIMIVNILGWIAVAIPELDWLHPWLLQNWALRFTDLLSQPMFTTDVVHGLWLAAGYVLVFGLAAWARFARKDITS